LFFPVFIKLLRQWKIFDSSGEHKIHSSFTPSMGGLSIFLGAVLTLVMGLSLEDWISMKYFFIALSLMFIIGLRDDILALSAKQKLYSQFLPILILVYLDKTILQSTYGIGGEFLFPEIVGMGLTVFVLLILTNAYNLIDGLDGLAGTIGVIILICLGVWFFEIGNMSLSLVAFTFSGSLIAFLYFNWQPSKIFMGDTGALMIGLLISYLTIKFININYALPKEHTFKFQSTVGAAVCLLIIPIFDTLRVIIFRLRKFQSPFKADKNHVHHQFIKLGFSHAKSVLFIAAISVFFISIAVLLRKQPDWVIISIAFVGCLGINFGLKSAQLNGLKNGTKN
jgi:UDP-GlcNAc:undecaprenyl-phosphate/decaprenyl-phosphate GlcNAc-1-phosphate transferase